MKVLPASCANVIYVQIFGWFEAEAALGFTLEAGPCLRISGDFLGQKFQGNKALEASVRSFRAKALPIPPPPSFSMTR